MRGAADGLNVLDTEQESSTLNRGIALDGLRVRISVDATEAHLASPSQPDGAARNSAPGVPHHAYSSYSSGRGLMQNGTAWL